MPTAATSTGWSYPRCSLEGWVIMVRTERSKAVKRRAEPSESYEEPDLIRQYLTQIASTPLLTTEEEVELGRRLRQGARRPSDYTRPMPVDEPCPCGSGPNWRSWLGRDSWQKTT